MNSNLEKAWAKNKQNAVNRRQQPANIRHAARIKQLEQELIEKDLEIVKLQLQQAESNTISSLCTNLDEQLQTQLEYLEYE